MAFCATATQGRKASYLATKLKRLRANFRDLPARHAGAGSIAGGHDDSIRFPQSVRHRARVDHGERALSQASFPG